MSKSLNSVELIGRLGRDPEVRYINSGKAVANFSIATSESWKNKDGDNQERTEWHEIVAWGNLAEICGEYLNKGSMVYVAGKLKTESWEDKDGNKRKTTKIEIDKMIMLGEKSDKPRTEKPEADRGPEDDVPF